MPLHGFGDTRVTGEIIGRNAERTARTVEHLIASAGVTPQIIVLPVLCLTGIGTVLRSSASPLRLTRKQ